MKLLIFVFCFIALSLSISDCSKAAKIEDAFEKEGYSKIDPPVVDGGDYYSPDGLVAPLPRTT